MKMKKGLLTLWVSVFLLPASSFAVTATRCEVIHWQSDHVYTIEGQINQATHVIFPISKAVNPVVGNGDLWHVESQANHVYLKPTDKDREDGKQSTLSFIGVNNHSYEFVLKRVASGAPECVVIQDNGGLMDKSWSQYQTPHQHVMKMLVSQLREEKKQVKNSRDQIITQQRNALNRYRSHIFSNYTWKGRGHWWGRHDINSVYDDGRWTYIRLNGDNKGIMSVYGIVSGHQELLQYHYDAQNKVYRVSGIYPRLVMIYDKNTIDIMRRG